MISRRGSARENLTHTDVTTLGLVVAEHVADRAAEGSANLLDEDDLVHGFVHAWQAEPRRGYGVARPGPRALPAFVAAVGHQHFGAGYEA
jgi:hypothetical protein